MGGCQDHVGGRAVLVRSQPVDCGHAPAVAGHEPGKAILRHGSDQVVADATLMLKERGRDHSADRVASAVLGTSATAPVTVEAGWGVDATRLKLSAQHITIAHRTSIAPPAAERSAPRASRGRNSRRLSDKPATPSTSCAFATRSRVWSAAFWLRRGRSCRLSSSHEVSRNGSCQIRIAALVCPTATARCRSPRSRQLWSGLARPASDRHFAAAALHCDGRVRIGHRDQQPCERRGRVEVYTHGGAPP